MTSPSLLDIKFLLLLLAIIALRSLVPRRYFTYFGVGSSVVLIGIASPETLVAIAGISLIVVYPFHRLVHLGHGNPDRDRQRKFLLLSGILILIMLMVGFKAYRFFTIPFFDNQFLDRSVVALFGFSYFLFRAINYLYINYLMGSCDRTPLPLLYFVLFPTTLTSGPIQKYADFRNQLSEPAGFTSENMTAALYRITRGYFRKVCIAFYLNELVEYLLAADTPVWYFSIVITVALYLYFYFDFAGYSDIAIGLGLLMGIRVPENFKQPFLSPSLSDFWRNWHISLVDWFRDHVFIPLGGMKAGRLHSATLAFLIMVLCGFWHGLTVSFVAWGLWHGANLFAEALLGVKPIPKSRRQGWMYWSRVLWTNARAAVGGLLFLPGTESIRFVLEGFLRW